MGTAETRPAGNRYAFVDSLYLLYSKLHSDNHVLVAEARRTLASLRRSLSGSHQASQAYGLVFDAAPAVDEQEAWLLVGGLFGLYPQPRQHRGPGSRRTLGIAVRDLRGDGENTVDRRFEQLIGVDRRNLPHHLRQAVTLLRGRRITLDYGLLLDDVIVLLDERADEASRSRVRLAWARDYHRPRRQQAESGPDDDFDAAIERPGNPVALDALLDTEN